LRIKDINPNGRAIPLGTENEPAEIVAVGDRVFFHANGGPGTGVEVWTSDGTEEGTHIVEDIRPGGEGSNPGLLTDVEGTLYFAADDGTTGYELWRSNAAGTDAERLTDLNTGGSSLFRAPDEALFVPLDGALYFGADDVTHGYELWRLALSQPVDSVPPTVTISTPVDGARYAVNELVVADFACADEGGSGLADCDGSVPDGSSVDTTSPGTKTFTVTATDGAGNSVSVSATYTVVATTYAFSGFLPPVDNAPTVNVMPAGKGVRLLFSLGGDKGLDIFEAGYPQARVRTCEQGLLEDKVEKTVNVSASRLKYQPRPDQYAYFWATQKSWRGQCRDLVLRLKDGTEAHALFRLTS
jgi:ELWxxDGT repeat protein